MKSTTRKGCHDVFNAFMVKDAFMGNNYDIPNCDTTADVLPSQLVGYDLTKSSKDYDSFVHFYLDDQKFDGPRGIWNKPYEALERLKKFKGVITPDFSTYQDMPEALKIYNTYRMRAFGHWLGTNGIQVINNVRWGTPESYNYCFEGIPKNSVVAIGTIGCIREKKNWDRFSDGLDEMYKRLSPRTIIVYGSAPEKFFVRFKELGVEIIVIPSRTSLAFSNEQAK